MKTVKFLLMAGGVSCLGFAQQDALQSGLAAFRLHLAPRSEWLSMSLGQPGPDLNLCEERRGFVGIGVAPGDSEAWGRDGSPMQREADFYGTTSVLAAVW